MKLSTSIILLSLVATGTDAFGVQRGQVSMRIGHYDMVRRQKFNKLLTKVDECPTKETVATVLLTPETSDLIEKCNWKLRSTMIRKVTAIARANGAEVDASFGVRPTQSEKELIDQARKVETLAARAAKREAELVSAQAVAEAKARNKAARIEKTQEALARAAEAKKSATPPAPEPVAEPEPVAVSEPEPVAVSDPEPVAVSEPEPVAVSEPEPVSVSEPEPVAVSDPEPVAVSEPQPVAVSEPEPVAVSEPEPVAEPAPAAATPAASGGDITPKRIKELRDATGAGMMDCKKALIDSDGDMEAATEVLRAKGLAKADKKASRIAAEGKIAGATSGSKAVLVEINCETDFVAKDASFMEFTKGVANAALAVGRDNVDELLGVSVDGSTVEETRQALVAKIGENIQVRRLIGRGGGDTTVGAYVHMNRIGVLVEIEGGTTQLAEDVAMHVAAMNPPFARPEDVSQEVLDKERDFLTQQALDSGKPKEIVEKMIEGRIRKYLEEICLVSQTYVKTNDKTVGKLLEENGAKMIGFTRIEVGEGIEKRQDDFAAEVAKMASGGV